MQLETRRQINKESRHGSTVGWCGLPTELHNNPVTESNAANVTDLTVGHTHKMSPLIRFSEQDSPFEAADY
jgi:hypothetical protein